MYSVYSDRITKCNVQCIMVTKCNVKSKVKSSMARSLPCSGESTTTECGVNYQLHAVITEAAQWGTPSSSQPQSATDNGVRDGRSN